MPFLLLMILMAASMPVQWPEPYFDFDPLHCVAATVSLVLGFLIVCWYISRRTVWKLTRSGSNPELIGLRYGRSRNLLFFAGLGLYAVAELFLGWGWAVTDLFTIRVQDGHWLDLPTLGEVISPTREKLTWRWLAIPGIELINLLPLLTIMLGSWFLFYDVERAFHRFNTSPVEEDFWTRGGYILYRGRQFLVLVFVPVLLLIAQQGLLRLYPDLGESLWMRATSLLMVPFLLIFLPLLLPTLLGWRPLPDGSTRSRLIEHARRLGFGYREIYLWDTRRGMANAMVVGVIPRARFVVFTDRLLEDLSEDEVDAVFGHEVGHAKHGHLLYYAAFLLLSVVTMSSIYEVLRRSHYFDSESQNWLILGPILFMAVYLFLVFGFLSRRCERQADLFGCRAGSCSDPTCLTHAEHTPLPPQGRGLCRTGIDAFVRALRKVESINGMVPVDSRNDGGIIRSFFRGIRSLIVWLQTWQHSTIEKRVEFLKKVQHNFELEARFQRAVFLLRFFFLALLVLTVAALGIIWGPEIILGAL